MKVVVKSSYCSTLKEKAKVADAMEQIICRTARGRVEFRQQEKTDAKYPELIPEFDAVYARTSRDRDISERMTGNVARERGRTSSSRGLIEVLASSACDHEGRRRFVAVKRDETTLVVTLKQFAVMRARQEEEYQELRRRSSVRNERQGKLLAMMERQQILMNEALEDLRKRIAKTGQEDLWRGGENVKRQEECRIGGRERYSHCWVRVSLG